MDTYFDFYAKLIENNYGHFFHLTYVDVEFVCEKIGSENIF